MKIPKGSRVEDVPMKTTTDFIAATKRAGTKTTVVAVESVADYQGLVRLLSATVRPFAVAISSPS